MARNEGQHGFQNHAGLAAQQHLNLHYFSSSPTQLAAEQSGDRQRREKALTFLKEEKSEHERAR